MIWFRNFRVASEKKVELLFVEIICHNVPRGGGALAMLPRSHDCFGQWTRGFSGSPLGRCWLGRVSPLLTAATWLLRALASWLITKRGSTFQYSFKSYILASLLHVSLVHSGYLPSRSSSHGAAESKADKANCTVSNNIPCYLSSYFARFRHSRRLSKGFRTSVALELHPEAAAHVVPYSWGLGKS